MFENRRAFLGGIAVTIFGTAGCTGSPGGGGNEGVDDGHTDSGDSNDGERFRVTSPAFDEGKTIPDRHTCSGADVSARLVFEGIPLAAQTLAIIVDDPDAPGGTFTHWVIWNVGADRTEIPEAVEPTEIVGALDDASQGKNDFGSIGYRGPCPPEDDGPHTYRFRAYALDSRLDVEAEAGRETVEPALDDATVTTDVLTGTFGR
ncbi:Phospholipid-binding protein [Halanaeroarchaeum sp. HSR-CO]|uniref:YbhB/YbcL family Raf kinase inhibitor-like protein n=1 Tax=Halanaeroarchaeum sp. HSR-CO TaxID=2866382 RepID=UPI00217CEA66|nr:YbhB/YbcL family Raf kinase inhibitor-like protein [Halanaeroarchaeum sp. HSR-CO]UWG48586.1 Phospholipid-binding protein [Halanaeroarchaeum sp. HSR-CO]